MTEQDFPRLVFDAPFDERAQFEAKAKGVMSCAKVVLRDGNTYPVVFYDTVRLEQDLEYEVSVGRMCVAEVGMIVVSEVTLEIMQTAVRRLANEGYFSGLKPL